MFWLSLSLFLIAVSFYISIAISSIGLMFLISSIIFTIFLLDSLENEKMTAREEDDKRESSFRNYMSMLMKLLEANKSFFYIGVSEWLTIRKKCQKLDEEYQKYNHDLKFTSLTGLLDKRTRENPRNTGA